MNGTGYSSALPVFLHETENEKSGKVWGAVQKYIKSLVGCLLLAVFSLAASRDLNADARRTIHQLFIYPESLMLRDYRVEMTPDLSARLTDLAFRAADPENYYALQILIGVGLRIKRYAVVNGEPGSATVLALSGNYGTTPKIVLEIRGPEFRAYANGRLIESWEDQRFTRGGFGFFSDGGAPPIKFVRILGLNSAARR